MFLPPSPSCITSKSNRKKFDESKSPEDMRYVLWTCGELATNQKVHRAIYRKSVQRWICQDFSHTVQPWNAALKLPRLRYTCTVPAASRVGRRCLYKSSVTNSYFFLHHSTASILPKRNFSSTMFAPLSKKTPSIDLWKVLPPLSFLASHVFLSSLFHSLTESKRP